MATNRMTQRSAVSVRHRVTRQAQFAIDISAQRERQMINTTTLRTPAQWWDEILIQRANGHV